MRAWTPELQQQAEEKGDEAARIVERDSVSALLQAEDATDGVIDWDFWHERIQQSMRDARAQAIDVLRRAYERGEL